MPACQVPRISRFAIESATLAKLLKSKLSIIQVSSENWMPVANVELGARQSSRDAGLDSAHLRLKTWLSLLWQTCRQTDCRCRTGNHLWFVLTNEFYESCKAMHSSQMPHWRRWSNVGNARKVCSVRESCMFGPRRLPYHTLTILLSPILLLYSNLYFQNKIHLEDSSHLE